MTARGPGGTRHLTERELELLTLLTERVGTVVPRGEIMSALWGRNDYFTGRSLDVFVSRLRRNLEGDPDLEIRSVRGVGFILDVRGGGR